MGLDHSSDSPIIPASQSLPEITIRALVLGVILTIILAAANAYLGLKVGQTVSASIPAAIISMSILRFFRNSNVLENTMVQTMASVGESLIAGVAFILPALIILHAWSGFYYWQTVFISLLGGTLGVLFTIPLRRALLQDKTLRYPEGIAISNVLRASANSEQTDMRSLTLGGLVGGLISLFQTGFQVLTDTFDVWFKVTSTTVSGFSLGLSPALIAAGYIVGVNVAISFMVGCFIGWILGVPVLGWIYGIPDAATTGDSVMLLYKSYIRYVGVGTMLVGALWTLCTLFKPITQSIFASLASLSKQSQSTVSLRTERDIPINYVLWGTVLMLIPIFIIIANYIVPADSQIEKSFHTIICGFSAIYVVIGGFLFCSISAYFAGLIGSSNTPVSGLLVSALLILCLMLLALFTTFGGGIQGKEVLGVVLAIGTCVVIGVGIAISNDTMQDLKVGQVVGATPWKQQLMLVLGVIVSAFVVPPILDLLYQAYGIGGVFPHAGMDKSQMLSAPQAALMATVADGVYTHNLQWSMIFAGAVLAVLCIIVDEIAKQFGTRLPVLAVGLAIYLPMNTTVPVIIGGLLAHFINRSISKTYNNRIAENESKIASHKHSGLLLACGIVAGSSIMGVVLAIPFAIKQTSDALKIMPDQYMYLAGTLSVIVTAIMCVWIYRRVLRKS